MAELQKIKAEKAVEEREREDGRREEEEKIRMENILAGNPLLKERYDPPLNLGMILYSNGIKEGCL